MASRGIIEQDNFALHYIDEGKGIPALVIGSALYYSRTFSQNLRNHLRLIFVDWRGFAQIFGDVQAHDFDMNLVVDDIEQVRKKLGLDKVMIIGHSAHAIMALEYAKKYQAQVSHVVMIGMAPNLGLANYLATEQYWNDSVWPERKAEFEKAKLTMPDEKLAQLSPSERFVKWYVIRQGPRIWYDYNFDASPLWEGVIPNMVGFDHIYGVILRDIDITKGLDALDKPVLLALGRYDFAIAPISSWDPIRTQFKDLTVKVFEKSSHSPYYEQPELFDEELLRWIGR